MDFSFSPLACIISSAPFALLVDDNLVVHAKLALRHSTQVALHNHTARDMSAQHLTYMQTCILLAMSWVHRILYTLIFKCAKHGVHRLQTRLLKPDVQAQQQNWVLPCGDMSRFTLSRTSRKSSLRRYLMPSRLQPICPVTWLVIWDCSSLVWKTIRMEMKSKCVTKI